MRRDLLDAAAAMFIEQGFAASMDGIAAAAGISKRTLYAIYPDKLSLFEAVLQWLHGSGSQEAQFLDPGLAVHDALYQHGLSMHALYRQPRVATFMRLMQKEHERFPETGRKAREAFTTAHVLPLKAYLDLRPAGELRLTDTMATALAFCRLVVGQIGEAYAAGHPPRTEDFARYLVQTIDLVLHGVMARQALPSGTTILPDK